MNHNLKLKTQTFVKGLPKSELHIHFEGMMSVETYKKICERNNKEFPFSSIKEAKKAYEFTNLHDFLVLADGAIEVLQNEEDFYEVTWEYLKKANEDNVRNIELTWGPTIFTQIGISLDTQVNGMLRAFDQAKKEFGMTGCLIWTVVKSHGVELSMEALIDSERLKHKIVGFGMAGQEIGYPPKMWQPLYEKAKEIGYKLTAHVGEEGGPEYVSEALDLLKLDRIDHGFSAHKDEKLMKRLRDERMHLTLCPISNLRIKVTKEISEGPARKFYDNKISISINSDDPPYFQGYMNDNFLAVANEESFNFSLQEMANIAKMSFEGSWLSLEEKLARIDEIDAYCKKNGVKTDSDVRNHINSQVIVKKNGKTPNIRKSINKPVKKKVALRHNKKKIMNQKKKVLSKKR